MCLIPGLGRPPGGVHGNLLQYTCLENILGYEVKWALESITMNKVSESDGIPAELFQTLKDDA